MTSTGKIIWTTAAFLAAGSLYLNLRQPPAESWPLLAEGEYMCPPQFEEEAERLRPSAELRRELDRYPELIKNASSFSEVWWLGEEAKNKSEAYNRQVEVYNDYLARHCRQ